MDTLVEAITATLVADGLAPVAACSAGRIAAAVAVEHLVGDAETAGALLGAPPRAGSRRRGVKVYSQTVAEHPCPRCGLEFVTPMPLDPEQVCADCATVEAVGPVGVHLATSTGVYLAAILHARAALRMGYVEEARDVLDAVEAPRVFDREPLPRYGGPRQRDRRMSA